MARVYDLAMTHKLDSDDFFIHRVQWHCADRGLNFFLVEPLWVQAFLTAYEKGEVWTKVLLNMNSEHHLPEEIYHRLVTLADAKHTRVIDPPAVALAAFNKATLHPKLVAAGFEVPHTLLVRREEAAAFRLSEEDRRALGTPFVIKPSMGYGRRGVIMDATGEADLLRSIQAGPDPCYLLQQKVIPRLIGGEPAYFRVYHVFGSLYSCWWNCFTDRYRVVTREEAALHGLGRLEAIVAGVAKLTGMSFFSSEIAVTPEDRFVLIDYVNDQCHMLSQSSNPKMGVPDEIVAAIAARLVEAVATRLIQK